VAVPCAPPRAQTVTSTEAISVTTASLRIEPQGRTYRHRPGRQPGAGMRLFTVTADLIDLARANGQFAIAAYLREPAKPEDARANGLLVLALSGDRVQAMTRFTSGMLQRFGLPPG
jgi:hypothetical protein